MVKGPGGLVINLPCTLSCPSLAFISRKPFIAPVGWGLRPRPKQPALYLFVSQHLYLFDDSEDGWSEFREGPRLAWNSGLGQASEPPVADLLGQGDFMGSGLSKWEQEKFKLGKIFSRIHYYSRARDLLSFESRKPQHCEGGARPTPPAPNFAAEQNESVVQAECGGACRHAVLQSQS